MNVINIIVKKNPLTEIYRKGTVKQLTKKNKKTTRQRRKHRILVEAQTGVEPATWSLHIKPYKTTNDWASVLPLNYCAR